MEIKIRVIARRNHFRGAYSGIHGAVRLPQSLKECRQQGMERPVRTPARRNYFGRNHQLTFGCRYIRKG